MPTLKSSVVRLPTLTVAESGQHSATYPRGNPTLTAARVPTLTVHGNYNRHGLSPNSGDGLATVIPRLPTLKASPNENRTTKRTPSQIAGKHGEYLVTTVARLSTLTHQDAHNNGAPAQTRRNTPPLNALVNTVPPASGLQPPDSPPAGGPLNPDWTDWLMGLPIGWTASKPLATPKFLRWLRSHGASSAPTPTD